MDISESFQYSIFYRPAFLAFYRMFCKIANIRDIDLKLSVFISDINSDNLAKFRGMILSCISKNRDFWDFGL